MNRPDDIRDVLVTHSKKFKKSRGLQMAKRVLGEGLLTSEGDFHLRQRRLSQPAFHRQRIASYGEVMAQYTQRHSAQWRDGAMLNVHAEMMSLTLAIVAKTLFDADVEGEASEIGAALTTVMSYFQRLLNPLTPLLEKLPLPATRRFFKAKDRLDETIFRIIAERRASGKDHGDLLSMLLQAQDVEGDGGSMSDQQLRDEALTLFLAGHETTANLLTWTWYLLSQNPAVEAKLHAELAAVLQGRAPTVADVPQLKYTEQIVTEAMRLYPPAWTIGRQCTEAVEIGGFVMPKGAVCLMSQYVMHHNGRYYPDPESFQPERWTAEFKATLPKFAYFPFGGGNRLCIGESFAWLEAILILATLAQQWQLRLAPEQRVEMLPQITLRPKQGMTMTLKRRE